MLDFGEYPVSALTLVSASFTSATIDKLTNPGDPMRGSDYACWVSGAVSNTGPTAGTVTISTNDCDNTAFTGVNLHVAGVWPLITIGPTATIAVVGPFTLPVKDQQEYSQWIVATGTTGGATIGINGINIVRSSGRRP